MSTRTRDEVVSDLPCQQTVVQVLIYIEEEVALTAINNDGQVAILYFIKLINHRVLIPLLLVRGELP